MKERHVFFFFLAKYVSSLARIRTGISDALISCEVLERLITKLYAPPIPQTSQDAGDELEMRSACAVAIGALTYNRTGFRLFYNLVRRTPGKERTSSVDTLFSSLVIQNCTTKSLNLVNDRVCLLILSHFSKVNEPKDFLLTGETRLDSLLLKI